MYRRFVWLLLLLAALLLLAGCASQTNSSIQPVTTGFSCQAAIHYRDLELVSQLTCTADGGVKTTFVLPKSLNGITLGWNGTDMTMELGDATIALPAEKVPESALMVKVKVSPAWNARPSITFSTSRVRLPSMG